jgi:DNA-binding MarR family transcriptional regulator
VEVKAGQIAHPDGDRSNSTVDNLAFLCLVHHDQYDSRTSQSKNLTVEEVKTYRTELHDKVLPVIEAEMVRTRVPAIPIPEPAKVSFDAYRRAELKAIAIEVIAEMHGVLRSVRHLAHRLAITTPTAERILFELAQDGPLRVDRPKGTVRKTYSMVTAPENRLIDTFISQLPSVPISEERFVLHRQHELDAVIGVNNKTVYAIETMFAQDRLSREDVLRHIQRLEAAKRELSLPNATGVLLIGITKSTKTAEEDLGKLERPDLLIRYVEMG